MEELSRRIQLEIKDENRNLAFEALTRAYLATGEEAVPKTIISLSSCLAGVVVARYSKSQDKERLIEQGAKLLEMINTVCISFADYLRESEDEDDGTII